MNRIIKFVFTVLGGILIGFGLGILAYKNAFLGKGQYEIAMVLSLILGGFFLALGIPGRAARYAAEDGAQAPLR